MFSCLFFWCFVRYFFMLNIELFWMTAKGIFEGSASSRRLPVRPLSANVLITRFYRSCFQRFLSLAWRAVWDATDDMGRPLSGGLYIYRIKAGSYSKTRKMVLLK